MSSRQIGPAPCSPSASIWAPSTALIEDGLRVSGFTDLADTVSARFRALCERAGFAELARLRTPRRPADSQVPSVY